jgi:hypothetical protein
MPPLRIYQPWVPWWLAAPMLIGYLAFAAFLLRDFNTRDQLVRIAVPPFLLFAWLVIPAAINARVITVSPQGIRVRNRPIPKGRSHDIPRRDIRACTIRTQYSDFDPSSSTPSAVADYLVGVDTPKGQIDIAFPYLEYEEAQSVAASIAGALNRDNTLPSIRVEAARQEPIPPPGRVLRIVLWGLAFIAATILGAVWELTI